MFPSSPPKRLDRLSRDTSVSSDTSTTSDMSTSTMDSEAPFLPHKIPLSSHKSNTKLLINLVALSLCMSVFCIVVCVLLYTGVLEPVGNPIPGNHPTCLPCQTLVTTPFPEQDNTINLLDRHFENRTMICCAKTPQQFSILFDKLVQRKMKEQEVTAAQKADQREQEKLPKRSHKTGGHLLAGLQHKGTHVGGWLADKPLSYLEGLHLADDRLVVQHGGLYLIYSQIYFKINMAGTSESRPVVLGHRVHRYSVTIPNGGKQDLLQAAHSCCGGSDEKLFFHTSHVVGVFHLSSRDEIYVTVSDPTLIYRDPARSYLGIFRLDK